MKKSTHAAIQQCKRLHWQIGSKRYNYILIQTKASGAICSFDSAQLFTMVSYSSLYI